VQLRWIVRSQELGSVGTRVIAVGSLDPPFWLQVHIVHGFVYNIQVEINVDTFFF